MSELRNPLEQLREDVKAVFLDKRGVGLSAREMNALRAIDAFIEKHKAVHVDITQTDDIFTVVTRVTKHGDAILLVPRKPEPTLLELVREVDDVLDDVCGVMGPNGTLARVDALKVKIVAAIKREREDG